MEFVGDISVGLIILIILIYSFVVLTSKDKAKIWSPITFVLLTYVYYVVIPYYSDESKSVYNISLRHIKYLTVFAAFMHLLFFLVGISLKNKIRFSSFNSLITKENSKTIGIAIFLISYLLYVPFGGFRISIFTQADEASMLENAGGITFYALNMIAVFTVSCCLLLCDIRKNIWWIIPFFFLTAITYIVGGFRFRLVVMGIAVFSFYYLYDLRRKINWFIIIPSTFAALLFFVIIGGTRDYGNGLNYDSFINISLKDVLESDGTGENRSVFEFSTLMMKEYQNEDLILLEPLWCAVTMPIPRSIFPAKPNGDYLRKGQVKVLGSDSYGAALFNFVEGYMSFGWIGVCVYGLILGYLSGIYWQNYKRNRKSIVAMLMLATYNGMTYFIISRGYLAGSITALAFYMLVPYWLVMLYFKFKKIIRGNKSYKKTCNSMIN